MVDHLIGKFWGVSGALITALLTLALFTPAAAQAAGSGSEALSQLGDVIPAPAQSAASAALSQLPSAGSPGASAGAMPASPPSVPVVVPPPPPPVPAMARPTPPPAPANPAPAAPVSVTVPAGVAGQTVSVPAQSVPQPDAAVQAALSEAKPSGSPRPDPALGGRTPTHRTVHPRARRHTGSRRSAAAAAATRRAPIFGTTAARSWSPVPVFVTTSRRGAQPAASARRAESRSESRHARHLAPRSDTGGELTKSPLALPLSAALPPGGADGSAAGTGGAAAGAAAAALLAFVGLCILRALLPGLLGMGLAPARTAFLVSRLERPG